MNLDDSDLLPVGGGSLRIPVLGPQRQQVATFTATRSVHPDELWAPYMRTTEMTRGGSQGDPLGSYRPGSSIEHEPLTENERASKHVAQDAAHVVVGQQIRAALRGA